MIFWFSVWVDFEISLRQVGVSLCSIFIFSDCSVFKAIGLLDTLGFFFGPLDTLEFRAAGYFDFFGPFDIQTKRTARHSKCLRAA